LDGPDHGSKSRFPVPPSGTRGPDAPTERRPQRWVLLRPPACSSRLSCVR
jgi:hypothetical protein